MEGGGHVLGPGAGRKLRNPYRSQPSKIKGLLVIGLNSPRERFLNDIEFVKQRLIDAEGWEVLVPLLIGSARDITYQQSSTMREPDRARYRRNVCW